MEAAPQSPVAAIIAAIAAQARPADNSEPNDTDTHSAASQPTTPSPAASTARESDVSTPPPPPSQTACLQAPALLNAVVAAYMDLKPKVDLVQQHQHHHQPHHHQQQQQQQQHHQQKIKKLVRRNASEKCKLIQMVHDNPILWDSRLPNFKGAEEEKTRAWEQIGKVTGQPGRRVARAFKSLRESYRRELAHVKIMGSGFKPKWSLYNAMDFLRDVIRERKGGSHAAEQAALGLSLGGFQQQLSNNNNNNNNSTRSSLKLSGLHHSSFNEAALNLSKCSSLNMIQDDYYYFVKPELELAAHGANSGAGAGVAGAQQPLPAHSHGAHQQQQQSHPHGAHSQHASPPSAAHDSRVSSTRNDNSAQNISNYDDMDASSFKSGDEASVRNAPLSNQGSDEVEELEAIDADFPYPLILDGSSRASGSAGGGGGAGGSGVAGGASNSAAKRRRKDLDTSDLGMDGDDDDDYEGQMLQQHRQLRQQNGGLVPGMLGMDMLPPPQTVREVLNTKFCGFISAKLNSMDDSDADNLMNKILMLLVQTQAPAVQQLNEVK